MHRPPRDRRRVADQAALALLRGFLRAVPDGVHARVAGRLADHLLRGLLAPERLAPLEGKCLCLAIRDTGNAWRLTVQRGRLRAETSGRAWDVRIQGNLADLLLLAARAEDPDTLFFARRLSLEGDTETGLYVKNLLDSLEPDWEAHVTAVLGPRAATTMRRLLRRSGLERPLRAAAGRLRSAVARLAAREAGEPWQDANRRPAPSQTPRASSRCTNRRR